MGHCRGRCWAWSSGGVGPCSVQLASWGAVVSWLGASGVGELGRGRRGPPWLAMPIGKMGRSVRGLEPGLLGSGGREE